MTQPLERQTERGRAASSGIRLTQRSQEIVDNWKRRLKREVPDARKVPSEPLLVDEVPRFLTELACSFQPGQPSADSSQATEIARAHARERQRLNYDLDAVMKEWVILRQAIFDVLEKDGPLNRRDRDRILDAIQSAMRKSAPAYLEESIHGRTASILSGLGRGYRYLFSVVVVGAAAGLQYLVWPHIHPAPFLLFYPAIIVAAYFGDGISAVVLSLLVILYFFLPPESSFEVRLPSDILSLGIFAISAGVIVHVIRRLHITLRLNAEALQREFQTGRNLQATVTDLERERDARERFVATLSHDLRNPLTTIKVSAQLLEKHGDDAERVWKGLQQIIDGVDRVDGMIEDLLDVNRLRAGQPLALVPEELDLRSLAGEVIRGLSVVYGDRFVIVGPEKVIGRWDQKGLRRVLENLLINAVKYGSANKPITLSLGSDSDRITFSIHNFGSYIPEGEKSALFEPYHRLEKTAEGRIGWGIGLSLVRGIVEAHHGDVAVKSTPAEGTTFTVTIPNELHDARAA